MKKISNVDEVINPTYLTPGSVVYVSGNASTPQALLKQIIVDESIQHIEILGVLLLGDIEELFSEKNCNRINHRVIFNSHLTRKAVNNGLAEYQLMHLSDIPRQLTHHIKPNVALISVSGPDNGGNYSLGTSIEGVWAAIHSAKNNNGLVIAEKNAQMPFVIGTTIPDRYIDFIIDSDYELPISPIKKPDERSKKIGKIISNLFIKDGTTLQYGIGEVPEAVTDAIIDKGVRGLGIFTELFSDAMRKLVEMGVVNNRYRKVNFSTSTLFLSSNKHGYDWMNYNCSIQSRPSDYTNNILNIAEQPNMVAVNSALGADLHGNIWADSLLSRKIYSGVGGQADFLRGASLSPGGVPIIAMKSTTQKGQSKILNKCPEGITTTAIAADPVIIVTEYGAFDPRGLSICEHAVGIAHLAEPEIRDNLLKHIYDSEEFHNPKQAFTRGRPKGFTPFESI